MPYIQLSTTQTLTDTQKEQLKTGFGQRISMIPGKQEAALFIDLVGNCSMYLAGQAQALAFLDVRLYGSASFEVKKAFTEEMFSFISSVIDVPSTNMYLTFSELEHIGVRGTLK